MYSTSCAATTAWGTIARAVFRMDGQRLLGPTRISPQHGTPRHAVMFLWYGASCVCTREHAILVCMAEWPCPSGHCTTSRWVGVGKM